MTGLVLAGGGPRGAYEVGVVAGILEALRLRVNDASPFHVFAGTSVGAINAAFFASAGDTGNLGAGRLGNLWCGLEMTTYFRPRPWLDWVRERPSPSPRKGRLGGSLLDPRPLEQLVTGAIAWGELHRNVRHGVVAGLFVAALELETGKTTVFAETSLNSEFVPSRDPRRTARRAEIGTQHVLASAAVPLLFPARKIDGDFYCDGGIRFNTPIAPALRSGVTRLVVISTAHAARAKKKLPQEVARHYPSLSFLAGKLLDALLLDPIDYDLHVLTRINRLIEMHQQVLDPEEAAALDRLLIETRGRPYRPVQTLVFRPSRDIGEIAADHLKTNLPRWGLGRVMRSALNRAAHVETEADWASYILFDGEFAEKLIAMGLADARERSGEIRRFFGA